MNSGRFFSELKRRCNARTDGQLANILGITPVHLSRLKSKNLDIGDVTRMIARMRKRLVSGRDITEQLKKKFQAANENQLCQKLRMQQNNLEHWLGLTVDSERIAGFIKAVRAKAIGQTLKYPLKPIVEYYPIKATVVKKRKCILDTAGEREKTLRKALLGKNGVYVFYNSQAEAIYVGKANELTLWHEINNAFNRLRDAQIVRKVRHPKTGSEFNPMRRIQKTQVYLHDIAHFFSAYAAELEMIDNLEAMLIRAFTNSLTNNKIENFYT